MVEPWPEILFLSQSCHLAQASSPASPKENTSSKFCQSHHSAKLCLEQCTEEPHNTSSKSTWVTHLCQWKHTNFHPTTFSSSHRGFTRPNPSSLLDTVGSFWAQDLRQGWNIEKKTLLGCPQTFPQKWALIVLTFLGHQKVHTFHNIKKNLHKQQ